MTEFQILYVECGVQVSARRQEKELYSGGFRTFVRAPAKKSPIMTCPLGAVHFVKGPFCLAKSPLFIPASSFAFISARAYSRKMGPLRTMCTLKRVSDTFDDDDAGFCHVCGPDENASEKDKGFILSQMAITHSPRVALSILTSVTELTRSRSVWQQQQ